MLILFSLNLTLNIIGIGIQAQLYTRQPILESARVCQFYYFLLLSARACQLKYKSYIIIPLYQQPLLLLVGPLTQILLILYTAILLRDYQQPLLLSGGPLRANLYSSLDTTYIAILLQILLVVFTTPSSCYSYYRRLQHAILPYYSTIQYRCYTSRSIGIIFSYTRDKAFIKYPINCLIKVYILK